MSSYSAPHKLIADDVRIHFISSGWFMLRTMIELPRLLGSILKRKGTDVTTIAPEATIKRAADWLRAKNIGALVVTSGNAVLGLISEREIVHAFSRYGETAGSMPVKEIMQYGATTHVTGRERQSRDEPDDAPSRAPHTGTTRRRASRYCQHRRCRQASTGGSGA